MQFITELAAELVRPPTFWERHGRGIEAIVGIVVCVWGMFALLELEERRQRNECGRDMYYDLLEENAKVDAARVRAEQTIRVLKIRVQVLKGARSAALESWDAAAAVVTRFMRRASALRPTGALRRRSSLLRAEERRAETAGRGDGEARDECPVCLGAPVDTRLPCGHAFCGSCIADWAQQQSRGRALGRRSAATCPTCRAPFRTYQAARIQIG